MIAKKFVYRAQIQRQDGEIIEREVACLWAPNRCEGKVPEYVANAAAAMEAYETKTPHVGISAVLVG